MDYAIHFLNQAAKVAVKSNKEDRRCFRLGSVGIRGDGAITTSRNGSNYQKCPSAHAETRLSRKLDLNATVFVARVTRDGSWAMSKPCPNCERVLRNKQVKKVYYTIGPHEYGVLSLQD